MTLNESDQLTELIHLAAQYLRISPAEAKANLRELPDIDAAYFSEPGSGGSAMVIGGDRSLLFATSSVGFAAHIEAFKQGRRTDPGLFGHHPFDPSEV